jgi:60S ribosome subunit biogenesis protein NIP7
MRPLTDEETKVLFTKLGEYIGDNIKYLIERTDEPYVFRLIKCKVYYMSESLMKLAQNVGKENLVHVGTCFGKFTNGGKFRVNVTCLDYLAKYAKNKVWLKP